MNAAGTEKTEKVMIVDVCGAFLCQILSKTTTQAQLCEVVQLATKAAETQNMKLNTGTPAAFQTTMHWWMLVVCCCGCRLAGWPYC